MMNRDPREFARMRAILFGRTCLMSMSKSLPADGSAPQWIEILPLGDFTTRSGDGRGPFPCRRRKGDRSDKSQRARSRPADRLRPSHFRRRRLARGRMDSRAEGPRERADGRESNGRRKARRRSRARNTASCLRCSNASPTIRMLLQTKCPARCCICAAPRSDQ